MLRKDFMQKQNILQRIKEHRGRFSKQHAKIAAYLMDNYEKAAFMSATQLAREVGVSQPTVIRFSQFLGFSQYSAFIERIQALLKERLTSTERLRLSLGKNSKKNNSEFDIIVREICTLDLLVKSFPSQPFENLVEQICRSHQVFIVGTRGSAALAQYFSYFLGKVKRNVSAVTSGETAVYDRLLSFLEKDLLIAIAFPRYPRETLDIVRFCRKREGAICGITDRIDSPLVELSDISITIPVTFSTIFDSYCSALCLFNMIVTRVGKSNREESETLAKEFEELAKSVGIFI